MEPLRHLWVRKLPSAKGNPEMGTGMETTTTINFFSVSVIFLLSPELYLFAECHIGGIIWYVTISDWLLYAFKVSLFF